MVEARVCVGVCGTEGRSCTCPRHIDYKDFCLICGQVRQSSLSCSLNIAFFSDVGWVKSFLAAGKSQPTFFKISWSYQMVFCITQERTSNCILKGFLWEFVRPLWSLDVVQLRVTVRCWNVGENCVPIGDFFFSWFKMDRSGEISEKNLCRDRMCNAATYGWCADWACVTLASKITFVQHRSEDHDEDIVNLGHNENLANADEERSTV